MVSSSCSPTCPQDAGRGRRCSPRLGRGRRRFCVQHGAGHVDEGPARIHGPPAQVAEGLFLGHPVSSHDQRFGLLDNLPVRQGLPEPLQLPIALHREVEGGRDLRHPHGLEQVGHHAGLPGQVDEPPAGAAGDEDHGAAGLVAETGEDPAPRLDRRRRNQDHIRAGPLNALDRFFGRFMLEGNHSARRANCHAQIRSRRRRPAQDPYSPPWPCRSQQSVRVSHGGSFDPATCRVKSHVHDGLQGSPPPMLKPLVIGTIDLTRWDPPILFRRHTIGVPIGGSMDRRTFLTTGAAALVGSGLARPFAALSAETSGGARWRTFEVTTRLEIIQPSGVTRAWVPLPLMPDTNYQKSLGQSWTGNAALTRVVRDEKYGAGIFYAEWPASETAPEVEVTTRFATHDREVDLSRPGNPAPEEKSVLRKYTSGTKFIPTDGIVRKQALEVSRGASTDVEKAFRDPKVRGCGLGDIKALLQTGYLGGKCADLNALFVGMVRSLGVPARDLYGVRVTESADYKSLGRSGDISKGQHCRAEFYATGYGWLPVDPADVRKLVLE